MFGIFFRKLRTLKIKLLAFIHAGEMIKRLHDNALRDSLDNLKRSPRYADPKHLIPYGYSVYSQNEEDGMIREIFNRIGTTNKIFVEFGVEAGLENNTFALLFEGWKGLWIEASETSFKQLLQNFSGVIREKRLRVLKSFITKENINELISSAGYPKDIDLLSVDIDGNDYWVTEAITCVKPRVIVLEYNAKFPPPMRYCMAYDASHSSNYDDCFGASLKFLETELSRLGYNLVGCCAAGVNAFFVRKDLAPGKFLAPFTAENHYEPPRYQFIALNSGHKTSPKTLETALKEAGSET